MLLSLFTSIAHQPASQSDTACTGIRDTLAIETGPWRVCTASTQGRRTERTSPSTWYAKIYPAMIARLRKSSHSSVPPYSRSRAGYIEWLCLPLVHRPLMGPVYPEDRSFLPSAKLSSAPFHTFD
ncbi:hypothetical protein PsYK624_100120 [Phanerochaete sordida]|uniref:Uncharacterized protein n=1 Tax=Phanerochaete sordida TaxID=48140 RepID=A0A9P3GFA7_9APHY|nr:hypothetical protein PsYK624_100120 [Phanerochaete sordida]